MNFEHFDKHAWLIKDNYQAYFTNGEDFPLYEDAEAYCKNLPDVKVFFHDSGMLATHNMPCSICKTEHAMFDCSCGIFLPCSKCQKDGWKLVKENNKVSLWSKFLCQLK